MRLVKLLKSTARFGILRRSAAQYGTARQRNATYGVIEPLNSTYITELISSDLISSEVNAL